MLLLNLMKKCGEEFLMKRVDWGRVKKDGSFLQGAKISYSIEKFESNDLINDAWVTAGGGKYYEYSLVWREVSEQEWEQL